LPLLSDTLHGIQDPLRVIFKLSCRHTFRTHTAFLHRRIFRPFYRNQLSVLYVSVNLTAGPADGTACFDNLRLSHFFLLTAFVSSSYAFAVSLSISRFIRFRSVRRYISDSGKRRKVNGSARSPSISSMTCSLDVRLSRSLHALRSVSAS